MRLEYFIAAESVALDQLTNRVSIFHVIDEVLAPTVPTVLPSLVTIASLVAESGDAAGEHVAVLHLGGDATESHELPARFHLGDAPHRLTHRLSNVPIRGAGTIELRLVVDGVDVAMRHVLVRPQ